MNDDQAKFMSAQVEQQIATLERASETAAQNARLSKIDEVQLDRHIVKALDGLKKASEALWAIEKMRIAK